MPKQMSEYPAFTIRPLDPTEYSLLDDFLYDAIFLPQGHDPLPRTVLQEPSIQNYSKDFGKEDDFCLVSEVQGRLVGAVWVRILSGEVKGYGYVDAATPELAISVRREFRSKGIGTALLDAMLALLQAEGYAQLSLSVQKENPAFRLYTRLGFSVIDDKGEDFLMLYTFKR